MVEQAVSEWEQQQQHRQAHWPRRPPQRQPQPSCIWLDVQSATEDDIYALASIFDIDSTTVRHLVSVRAGKVPSTECSVTDMSLYLCWAETTATGASAKQYISHGTIDRCEQREEEAGRTASATDSEQPSAALVGGYIPVPPWLQPSATQVRGQLRFDKIRRQQKTETSKAGTAAAELETAQREQVREMLALLDRPVISNKERTRAALQRWGPEYELWWQDVLLSTKDEQPRLADKLNRISERLGQGTRDLIGYRLVQAWTRGPILLTFHAGASRTVQAMMSDLAWPSQRLRDVGASAIVEHCMAHWVATTRDCLSVIERYADRLDHDLTRPVQTLSTEAASWTPVIARCRKVALALLRHCQDNETAVIQLCSATRTLRLSGMCGGPGTQGPAPDGHATWTRHSVTNEAPGYAENGLWRQQSEASMILKQYKKAEQRLSRLHTILLDRQRLRLLSTQRKIHQYFRILISVSLVFLPIELWYNLDNLNGITTPGTLQPEDSSDEDFLLSVLGMMVWAVVAILLYAVYIQFFERKPEALRVTNISGVKRQQPVVTAFGLFGLLHVNYDSATDFISGNGHIKTFQRHVSYRPGEPKPVKACFVILARNQDWRSLRESIKHMEDRFNHRFNYPYVFLNDQPFSDEFKNMTQSMTLADVHYGQIAPEHWSYPEFIDQDKARASREKMHKDGVMYGDNESYRHMCRFESGLFFKHELLQQFDFYWRLEPGVQYLCDINYDPFLYMKQRNIKYGWTIGIYELMNTVPTLWDSVKKFMATHPQLIPEHNSLWWVSRDNGTTYNGCHFWSNFEIADLTFYRSEQYTKFFNFLDREGGFFYERWGDAPVHSIAAALFLQKEEVHWFDDIGYYHPGWQHCPTGDAWKQNRCTCDPNDTDKTITAAGWGKCSREWALLPDTPAEYRKVRLG
ncbi:hypothetical protein IWW39_005833 [Coemansia spiralis]|uniref:Uncharacterized protein n=1 Tax=Coemansia spiralis TaxID=417178 RepID=A0A9W8GGB5_9FUNG|nr:hypothetical protein IWW39_005833 [Coemansia spiralis]